ncbi:MAG: chromosome segregation protein SMC, partial [Cytophagales bacterium]
MQLSKLEIKGFKSFGDKVNIHFDKGITGIVGPNGCGKSNVVDSIRWVLGEQKTRALRSDKMENIIFNGSKNRKALQMAEVSISFNNTKNLLPTDYTQVTITRRYYRTGESEYQLNGVTCRLKDINDLFLDTGIGPDSYAIIELKMVDDILNDKDHSRRELFEEAAGISKFKIRKKQSLKKLDETDADLARVDDLLFEIEKNLKSLEKQAKQAEKFYQLKDEYKTLSVQLALQQVKKSKERFDHITGQIQQEKDLRLSLEASIVANDAKIEELKMNFVMAEKLVGSRQKFVNEHIAKIREYESNKKIQNERLRYLTGRQQQILDQLENDQKNNARVEFSLKSLADEILQLEKSKELLTEDIERVKNDLDVQKELLEEHQEEFETCSQNLISTQTLVHELNKSIEVAQAQLNTLLQELEKSQNDNTQQYAGMADFEEKVSVLQQQLDSKEEELSDLKEREFLLQERIEKISTENDELKDKLAKQSRILDSKQNEFNLTKSLVDNLEGFPEAVRFLKKNVESTKNAPILSDIITCDPKYRVLIENYLEPFLNYFILEKPEDALSAINLLSNATKGKAHFFVLSQFKNYIPEFSKPVGEIVCAYDIVEYDEKYKNLFAYLLQDVFIVKGEEESIPEKKEGVFISLSGKVVKRKYSYSGGSVGLFEGKRIGRAKNLEKLEKEISSLTAELMNIRQEQNKKNNLLQELKQSTKKTVLEALTLDCAEIKNQLSTYKAKLEQLKTLLQSSEDRQAHLNSKIES